MIRLNPFHFLGEKKYSSICPKNSTENSIQKVSAPRLPLQTFHCSRKFFTGTTRKVVYHLLSNQKFRNVIVNGREGAFQIPFPSPNFAQIPVPSPICTTNPIPSATNPKASLKWSKWKQLTKFLYFLFSCKQNKKNQCISFLPATALPAGLQKPEHSLSK